jgi:hypothetical protein
MALFWPNSQECSIGATHPADATAALSSVQLAPLVADAKKLGAVIELFFGVSKPTSLIEITTMP